MRIVPINEAEAIIEPFFDGGSSEHPDDKYSYLTEYDVNVLNGANAQIRQFWNSVNIAIESAQPNVTAVTLKRDCDLDISEFDTFRLFANFPKNVCVDIYLKIDGKEFHSLKKYIGIGGMDEVDSPMNGKRLEGFTLALSMLDNNEANISIKWIGISNLPLQKKMENRKNYYTSDWHEHIYQDLETDAVPDIGIYFNKQELINIRKNVKKGIMSKVYQKLHDKAVSAMENANPESIIGEFAPEPNEYCRLRDMKNKTFRDDMETLAFVGLIENNADMLKMAARMAICVCFCKHWYESIMGEMPGATWHHRSFTESNYSRACALVLDWAGSYLTPYGKQLIRHSIIMKGLPRIEADFKCMEYIRSMNQGIGFSDGRIIGLLAVVQHYPRYKTQIDEAEKDLVEIMSNYINPDGATLEGISYWGYAIGSGMKALYALSRYREKHIRDYVPESVLKTSVYPMAESSTVGNGAHFVHLVDDAPNYKTYVNSNTSALFARITMEPFWKRLYYATLEIDIDAANMYDIIFYNDEIDTISDDVKIPSLIHLDVAGYVRAEKSFGFGKQMLFFVSGPIQPGHCHEDKGSIVLEAGGEEFLIDRGTTMYYNPQAPFVRRSWMHNMVTPVLTSGKKAFQIQDKPAGGKIEEAFEKDGIVFARGNQLNAWCDSVFDKNIRRIAYLPNGLILIDDDICLCEDGYMNFNVNTRHTPLIDNGIYLNGQKANVIIKPVNWQPKDYKAEINSVDYNSNPVYLAQIKSTVARSHRLITLLDVVDLNTQNNNYDNNIKKGADIIKDGNNKYNIKKGEGVIQVELYDNELIVNNIKI